MKTKLKFLIPFFLIVLFGSYLFLKKTAPSQHQPEIVEEVIDSMIPGEFIEFYMRFHLDTAFQKAHIVFPLQQKEDGSKWTSSEWIYHRPFNNHGGEFVQDFRFLNGIIFEIIQDIRGQYKIEKRYVKSNGAYNLIYYSSLNTFEKDESWQ